MADGISRRLTTFVKLAHTKRKKLGKLLGRQEVNCEHKTNFMW